MSLTLHVPGSVDGWLRRRDTRWKLAAFLPACLAVALLKDPGVIALAALGALALALLAQVQPGWLVSRALSIAGMILVFFGWLVFVPRPDDVATWSVGPLAVSPRAVAAL